MLELRILTRCNYFLTGYFIPFLPLRYTRSVCRRENIMTLHQCEEIRCIFLKMNTFQVGFFFFFLSFCIIF